jgi:hypothetical protein
MKLATVKYPGGTADLTESGWVVPFDQGLARVLNLAWPVSNYGPSAGDPVICAAGSVAEALCGVVTFSRIPTFNPDAVH